MPEITEKAAKEYLKRIHPRLKFDAEKHEAYVKNKLYRRPCSLCGTLTRLSGLKLIKGRFVCLNCRRKITKSKSRKPDMRWLSGNKHE